MHWLPTQESKYLPLGSYPDNLTIRLSERERITQHLVRPGLIGPRLWIQAATVQPRSRATNAVTVDAAGPAQRLSMSHTPNTKPTHTSTSMKHGPGAKGYRPQAPSLKHQARIEVRGASLKPQATSLKLKATSRKLPDP